jgi:hypothetical protein
MSKIIDLDNTPCYSTYCGVDFYSCGEFGKMFPISNPDWRHTVGIRRYDLNWELIEEPETKLPTIRDPWNRPLLQSFSEIHPVNFWRAEDTDSAWTDWSLRFNKRVPRYRIQLFRGMTTVEGFKIQLALVHVPYEKVKEFTSVTHDDKDMYVTQL